MIYKKDDYDILDYVKNNNVYQLDKPANHLCINCGVFLEESLLDIRVLINGEGKGGYKLPNYCEYYEKDRMLIIKDNNIISLKIDNIDINKIYSIKHNGLIIASRGDGFGARMIPMLNAMYLADKTGYKFGFVWKELNKDVENAIYVCSEEEIFDKDFIEKHSYTDCEDLKYFLADATLEFDSLDDFLNKRMEEYWGWYCSNGNSLDKLHINGIDINEYMSNSCINWKKVVFSRNYITLQYKLDYILNKKLNNNFIAIHIRSGDIVYYDDFRYSSLMPFIANKYAPWEVALEIVKKNVVNNNVVVFSDNDCLANEIKKYINLTYNDNLYKVYICSDLYDKSSFSNMEQTFFEVNLLSRSIKAIGNGGGFMFLTQLINNKITYQSFIEFIDLDNQVGIIINNKSNLNIDNIQRASSYAYLFYLCLKKQYPYEKLIDILECAIKYDSINLIYYVALYDLYLQLGDSLKASKVIDRILVDKVSMVKKYKIINKFIKKYKEASNWDYNEYNECSEIDFKIDYLRSLRSKFTFNIFIVAMFSLLKTPIGKLYKLYKVQK